MTDTRLPIRLTDGFRSLLLAAALLACISSLGIGQPATAAADEEPLIVTPNPVMFRCTPVGESDTIVITVTNPATNRRTVMIRNYEIKSPHFKVPATANVALQPGKSRNDTIIFTPQMPSPPGFSHRAEVRIDQGSGDTRFIVQGPATPEARLVMRRDTVVFNVTGAGDVVEQCIGIANPACRTIEITDLELPAPFEIVKPAPLPYTVGMNMRDEICIRYTAGPLDMRGTLKIRTADGGSFTIPLRARADLASSITINPRPVVFNNVPANTVSDPVTITVSNIGNAPDRLTSWEISGPDSSNFSIQSLSLPDPLPPQSQQSAAFAVRFAPNDSGPHNAQVTFHFEKAPFTATADLSGNAVADVVLINPRDVDIGDVVAGETATRVDTLVVRNIGTAAVDVLGIDLLGTDRAFFAVATKGGPTVQPGGGELKYDVTFTPDAVRDFEIDAVVRLQNGGRLPIKIRGRGVARPAEVRRVWIESTQKAVPVNQRFTLMVHAAAPLTAADGVSTFLLVLRVDHRALYPHRAVSLNGGRDTLYYRGADTVVIEHLGGPAVVGADLVGIEFEGLVTGQPLDTVELVEASFPGSASAVTTGNGTVSLEGCDVGSGLAYSKPIAARGAWPVPARDGVTISYVAPEGSRPWARVVDAAGREVRSYELPDGNGGMQTTTITTAGLGSGMYFVELHAAGEMSVVRMIVGR